MRKLNFYCRVVCVDNRGKVTQERMPYFTAICVVSNRVAVTQLVNSAHVSIRFFILSPSPLGSTSQPLVSADLMINGYDHR
jgi:hypothetical protein